MLWGLCSGPHLCQGLPLGLRLGLRALHARLGEETCSRHRSGTSGGAEQRRCHSPLPAHKRFEHKQNLQCSPFCGGDAGGIACGGRRQSHAVVVVRLRQQRRQCARALRCRAARTPTRLRGTEYSAQCVTLGTLDARQPALCWTAAAVPPAGAGFLSWSVPAARLQHRTHKGQRTIATRIHSSGWCFKTRQQRRQRARALHRRHTLAAASAAAKVQNARHAFEKTPLR